MGRRFANFVAAMEEGMLSLLLVALIGLAGGQVVARNVLDVGVIWIDPLLRVMILWIGMIGAMVAARTRNHITMDAVVSFVSERQRPVVRLAGDAFTAGVCLVLAYHGARLAAFDREAGMLAFAGVPVWVCELILPLGFAVIAWRYMWAGAATLRGLWEHKP